MTFQPPPPPPGGTPPPPPPPAQWGPGPQHFDPKSVNSLDWGILGAGVLTFIFSFFDYYTASVGPYSASESAWHGFFGWFAMLLAVAGSVVVGMELFAPQVKMPWPSRLVALGAYALALVCMIIAGFVTPGVSGDTAGVSFGRGIGFYGSLIFILAGLVLSLMRAQQTGTRLPGPLANMPNIGAKGPQGGLGGHRHSEGFTGQHNQPPPPPPPPAP
jgi:hypothetical protein